MSETPRDEQRNPEKAARSRGEDESAEVEGHMKTRNPEEAARSRGEDESAEVEGHLRSFKPEDAARSRDEDEKESPDEGRLAARQPDEQS